jgi:hypothetical protein
MIRLGYGAGNQAVGLDSYDLRTHVHGLGLPRTGKTKLIEQICRELVRQEKGFCLIDPHGHLYYDLLAWFSFVEPEQDIVLFNPSHPTRVTGYNPFRSFDRDPAALMTQTNNMVSATLVAWGAKTSFDYPRLRKWLTALYYTLIEQRLPLSNADLFLGRPSRERDEIINRISSEKIRNLWLDIFEHNQTSYLESVESRMEMFSHPTVRSIMETGGLEIPEILDTNAILLCNFQRSRLVSSEANRVLGMLLVNEFWEYFATLQRPKQFYLLIDECQRYINPEIEEIVTESSKYGLHLFLFNQQGDQGGKDIERMLASARIKIRFDGSTDRVFTLERPKKGIEIITSEEVKDTPRYMLDEYEERLMARWPLRREKVELDSGTQESPRTQIFSNAPEEISDDDLFE